MGAKLTTVIINSSFDDLKVFLTLIRILHSCDA